MERALSTVPREDFLGPGPWTVLDPAVGAIELAGDDPRLLYEDVLVVLDRARGLNNGSPSLHALMLHHLGVRPGDRVLHVGAGAGYYTAMLAELAGPAGQRHRHRIRPAPGRSRPCQSAPLADRHRPPGRRRRRGRTGAVDRIYVNFAVADPARRWIDQSVRRRHPGLPARHPAGAARRGEARRHSGHGAVLAFTRTGAGIAVRHLTPCAFVCAEGSLAGTAALREALDRAFIRGGVEFVRSYRRPPPASPERCWFWSPDWALSYDEPGAA